MGHYKVRVEELKVDLEDRQVAAELNCGVINSSLIEHTDEFLGH